MTSPPGAREPEPDWEAFYGNHRSPDYVPGYEITGRLGRGTTSLVFRARKKSIGKDYVIKFLKVDDPRVRSSVLEEIDRVHWFAQVDHPNLVAIEDRGEVDGIPFLVMAHAGDETLRDGLESGNCDSAELLRYFLQACRGVAALHERSLVHFHLGPENVFLKGGGARVGGYGLSKLVVPPAGSLSSNRARIHYMAPEMLQRRGDARSDVYSLGVILYEILTGEVPFSGDSEREVLRKHEVEAPSYPAHVTAAQKAVLERCLAKDPDERYASVHELMEALGAPVSAGDATVADAFSAPASARPAATRTKVAAAGPGTGDSTIRRSRSPARGTGLARAAAGLFLLLTLGLLATFSTYRVAAHHEAFVSGRNRQVHRVSVQRNRVLSRSDSLEARLREFTRSARRAVLRAKTDRDPSVPRLRELSKPQGYSGFSLRGYQDLLSALAVGVFSPGHARKLEIHGYPMFLAAVDYLQDLDYHRCEDQQRAYNVHCFLVQATGLEPVDMYEPHAALSRTKAHANLAVADTWRRFAERFCHDEDAWHDTLKTTGKLRTTGH